MTSKDVLTQALEVLIKPNGSFGAEWNHCSVLKRPEAGALLNELSRLHAEHLQDVDRMDRAAAALEELTAENRKLAAYIESTPVETTAPKSKFDLAFEIMRQLDAERMDTMQSCHFGYVLRIERERSPEEPAEKPCRDTRFIKYMEDGTPYCGACGSLIAVGCSTTPENGDV